jgi:hypothetical protein
VKGSIYRAKKSGATLETPHFGEIQAENLGTKSLPSMHMLVSIL